MGGVSPYTSALVLDKDNPYARVGIPRASLHGSSGGACGRLRSPSLLAAGRPASVAGRPGASASARQPSSSGIVTLPGSPAAEAAASDSEAAVSPASGAPPAKRPRLEGAGARKGGTEERHPRPERAHSATANPARGHTRGPAPLVAAEAAAAAAAGRRAGSASEDGELVPLPPTQGRPSGGDNGGSLGAGSSGRGGRGGSSLGAGIRMPAAAAPAREKCGRSVAQDEGEAEEPDSGTESDDDPLAQQRDWKLQGVGDDTSRCLPSACLLPACCLLACLLAAVLLPAC